MKMFKYIFILLFAFPLVGIAQTDTGKSDNSETEVVDKQEIVSLGFNWQESLKSTTAAIATVETEGLHASALNPGNSLYGTLPGLSVMQGNNVAWDNDPTLFIRGIGSLNNNTPLVLIDGYERPLSAISWEEIETISVLKDAASLALYGIRGANGVVLVTTKRGTNEGMDIKVSYQFGFQQPFRLPEMADGYTYACAMNEALIFDGLNPVYSQYDLSDLQNGKNPELLPNVDWINESIRNKGYTNQIGVSFRGGSEKVSYYSTINYMRDDGFLKPVDLNPDYNTQMKWLRLIARTNLDIKVTPTTLVKLNIQGQISQHNRPTAAYATLFSSIYSTPSAAFPIKTSNNMWGGNYIHSNPVAEISERGYTSSNDRGLFSDLRIVQDLSGFINGLSAEVAIAYDNRASYWDGKSKTYANEVITYSRDEQGNITDVTRVEDGQESTLSFGSQLGYQNRVTTIDGKINFNRQWNDVHSLNSSLMYRMEENSLKGQNNTFRRQSIMGNFHYGLREKYFLNLALSYSGSSVMNDDKRFFFYPAVSGAWLLSSEDFLSGSETVNYLKLRVSTGLTGSDLFAYNLGKYYFYMGNSNYFFGANNNQSSGTTEGRLPTRNLRPEKSFKSDFGVDLELFGKLALTADIFYEKRNNILVSSASNYLGALGALTPMLNEGEVENKGVELGLTWKQDFKDFSYFVSGNFSFARNKILNMNEEYRPEKYLERTGQRVGQYFGLEAVGFFTDEADIANSPVHSFSTVSPGDIKYKDQNKDGIINDYDMIAIGYSTLVPEIYYGFSLGFNYKRFGLKADFQGVTNYSVQKNMDNMYWTLRNNKNVSNHYLENRWTPDNQNAKYPRLTTLENANNYRDNSIWLEDGSFLKLRNIELSYRLPKFGTSWIKSGTVFFQGMNLFSIDNIKVLDPELMYTSYPSSRSYNVGINFEF